MRLTILALLGTFAFPLCAQIPITTTAAPAAAAPTLTFDAYTGAGISSTPTAGQLDSDDITVLLSGTVGLDFGGSSTDPNYGRGTSTGAVTTGGVYAFTALTGPALGIQPTGSVFAPGQIGVRYRNTTGQTLTSLTLSYDVLVYNDQARSNSFDLRFATAPSASGGTLAAFGGTLVPVNTADFATPAAASAPPAWVATARTVVLDGLSVADGDYIAFFFFTADVAGSGSRDEIAVDNIALSASTATPTASTEALVIGSGAGQDVAGWRMLAAPRSGLTVGSLASQNLVQGVDGSFPGNGANLLLSYNGNGASTGFVNPAGTSTATPLEVGRGLLWYFYDITNDAGSEELPDAVALTGPARQGDVPLLFPSNADRFYFLGNPYDQGMAFSGVRAIRGALLSDAFSIWNPATGSYTTRSALVGDVAAIGQGFFGELLAGGSAAPAFTYARSSRTQSGPLVGRGLATEFFRSQFTLTGQTTSGQSTFDEAAHLMFVEGGTDGLDIYDGTKLGSLNPTAALIAFVGESEGEAHYRAQESRPYMLTAPAVVPMAVLVTGEAGTYTLAWPGLAGLPASWQVELRDLTTGDWVDLRAASSYTFDAAATDAWDARFVLTVTPDGIVASEPGVADADRFVGTLYPNPSTQARLRLELGQTQHVRVRVYDVLGRLAATSFEGTLSDGVEHVLPMPADLAPGVYSVRVDGATASATYQMTVVR